MDRFLGIAASAKDFLPITVVVAIVIFILKETLEAWRRSKANDRKRIAIRRLVSDEIERNNWTIRSIRQCLFQIERALAEQGSKLLVGVGTIGDRYLRRVGSDGLYSQMPFGRIHSKVLEKNLQELAIVDEANFKLALDANDAIKELEHVLHSMIEYVSNNSDPVVLDTFVDYARNKIADVEETLGLFYKSITGKALEDFRLR